MRHQPLTVIRVNSMASSAKFCKSLNFKFFKNNFVVIYSGPRTSVSRWGNTVNLRNYFATTTTTRPAPDKDHKELDYVCTEIGVPVPGGTLAGKLWESKSKSESSKDVPPIICLHGWLDNAGTFDLMLPFMVNPATKYFCLDFPGHGLTTYCPDWWYDSHMEGILAVKRVAKHFGWDKFSILGHSMGGIVGFLYSGYFPDEIHKLVALENMRPLPIPNDDNVNMMRVSINVLFEVEERIKKPKKTYDYQGILQKLYDGRQGTVSREGCAALLKRGATKMADNHYNFSYNLRTSIPGQEGRTSPELSLELAKEITSPVCFIKAEPGNVYDTKEERENFISVLRKNLGDNFEYHTVPGSHHFHLNDPNLIAPIALKFLMK